ncbi:MAG: hypothetical protein ACO2XZ_01580 [Rickettsiales bacterium]
MKSKEQELTYQNISNFFTLAEEMLQVIEQDMGNKNSIILLERIKIIEHFLEQAIELAEELSHSYSNIVNNDLNDQDKEIIRDKLILLIVELEGTIDKLKKMI